MGALPNSGENKKRNSFRTFRRLQKLPPWRLMLHRDSTPSALAVIETLVELTPLTRPAAAQCLADAHQHGRIKLLVTHQERAELYCQQLIQRELHVTIEPDV